MKTEQVVALYQQLVKLAPSHPAALLLVRALLQHRWSTLIAKSETLELASLKQLVTATPLPLQKMAALGGKLELLRVSLEQKAQFELKEDKDDSDVSMGNASEEIMDVGMGPLLAWEGGESEMSEAE